MDWTNKQHPKFPSCILISIATDRYAFNVAYILQIVSVKSNPLPSASASCQIRLVHVRHNSYKLTRGANSGVVIN